MYSVDLQTYIWWAAGDSNRWLGDEWWSKYTLLLNAATDDGGAPVVTEPAWVSTQVFLK